MFEIIHNELLQKSFNQYELSNYALPGFESRHNRLYWDDSEYWGLGLSSHSYSKKSPWGSRFWNVNSFEIYSQQSSEDHEFKGFESFHSKQIEHLNKAQSLTDFCYTALRLNQGLSVEKLVQKFGSQTLDLVEKASSDLIKRNLMKLEGQHLILTRSGQMISNQLFEKFSFSEEDLI